MTHGLRTSYRVTRIGEQTFLFLCPAERAVLQHINIASHFLLLLTTYEHFPSSSQKSIVFKGICKIHDSFVYLYFWLRVQMGNSRILEPTTFANEMCWSNCQEEKSQPSSLECCSWPLIALSQWRGSWRHLVRLEQAGAAFPAARILACLALVLLYRGRVNAEHGELLYSYGGAGSRAAFWLP